MHGIHAWNTCMDVMTLWQKAFNVTKTSDASKNDQYRHYGA
jgi:hypothetical protein